MILNNSLIPDEIIVPMEIQKIIAKLLAKFDHVSPNHRKYISYLTSGI